MLLSVSSYQRPFVVPSLLVHTTLFCLCSLVAFVVFLVALTPTSLWSENDRVFRSPSERSPSLFLSISLLRIFFQSPLYVYSDSEMNPFLFLFPFFCLGAVARSNPKIERRFEFTLDGVPEPRDKGMMKEKEIEERKQMRGKIRGSSQMGKEDSRDGRAATCSK